MKRFLVWLALIVLAGASASSLTDLYDLLEPELGKFYSSPGDHLLEFNDFASSDPQAAAAALERAQEVVADYADEFPEVSQSINEYLDQAKAAITFRNSTADLELRLWSVKGVLGRALYQEAAQLASEGDAEASQAAYRRFISVTSRTPDLEQKAASLIAASNGEALELLSARALAYAGAQTFELTREAENPDQAFALAAKAYGLMLASESTWADQSTISALADGLSTLASGELTEFKENLGSIQAQAETYLASTEGAIQSALSQAEASTQLPATASEPSTEVSTPSGEVEPTPPSASAETEIPTEPVPQVAETDTAVEASAETEIPTEPVPQVAETDTAVEVTLTPAVTGNRLIEATLEEELAQLPQSQEVLDQMGLVLAAQGYDSVLSWLDQVSEVRGVIASAQSFAQTGDSQSAQIYLEYALTRYDLQVFPIAEIYNPDLAQRTRSLFKRMVEAPAIRTSDIAVLVGELQEVEESLFGASLGSAQAALVSIEQATLGLPRAAAFILTGLLAIFPIYLLQITFGRVSRYWRYVQYAFFFLLLPALLEALSYIGSLLATYGGLPALGFLSNFSILQNVGTQLLWGVLLLLVVIFATIGWYGLAVQFGVLRERGTATIIETPTGYGAADVSQSQITSATTLEWDPEEDEF